MDDRLHFRNICPDTPFGPKMHSKPAWLENPMNVIHRCTGMALMGLALLVAGCFGSSEPTDLSSLSQDADGDGYMDLTPPDGVAFDAATNLRLRTASDVDRDDLAAIATTLGVDSSLLSVVEDRIVLTIHLDYGNGITQEVEEVRQIEPFDLKIEVACPVEAVVDVLLQGTAPIIGSQDIYANSFVFTRGTDYACGDHIEVTAEVNEFGSISINMN